MLYAAAVHSFKYHETCQRGCADGNPNIGNSVFVEAQHDVVE